MEDAGMKVQEEMRQRALAGAKARDAEMQKLRAEVELETCTFCKFWSMDLSISTGACRRYAPRPGAPFAGASWPLTAFDDACGEWAANAEVREDAITERIKAENGIGEPQNVGGREGTGSAGDPTRNQSCG